jgi:HSP20 family molecular chaperone IbpA
MTTESKAIEAQEQEMVPDSETERTRERICLVPRADIYETDENISVTLDMPGVSEESIDITLEKNVLTINGYSDIDVPEGYSLAMAEYEIGDYERSFRLTDRIDQDGIEAVYTDGVLHLTLPKAEGAKVRKISIKAG